MISLRQIFISGFFNIPYASVLGLYGCFGICFSNLLQRRFSSLLSKIRIMKTSLSFILRTFSLLLCVTSSVPGLEVSSRCQNITFLSSILFADLLILSFRSWVFFHINILSFKVQALVDLWVDLFKYPDQGWGLLGFSQKEI